MCTYLGLFPALETSNKLNMDAWTEQDQLEPELPEPQTTKPQETPLSFKKIFLLWFKTTFRNKGIIANTE